VKPAHQPTPHDGGSGAATASSGSGSEAAAGGGGAAAGGAAVEPMVSPGMLLTHYSPDLPAYLLRGPQLLAAPPAGAGSAPLSLGEAVLLDFGG